MSAYARFHSAPADTRDSVPQMAGGNDIRSPRPHSVPPSIWGSDAPEEEPEVEMTPMLSTVPPAASESEIEEPEPTPPILELAALRVEETQPEPEYLADVTMTPVAPAPAQEQRPATPFSVPGHPQPFSAPGQETAV